MKINWTLLAKAFAVVFAIVALFALMGCNDSESSSESSSETETFEISDVEQQYVDILRGTTGEFVEGVPDEQIAQMGRNVCESFGQGIDYYTQMATLSQHWPPAIGDRFVRAAVSMICPEYMLAIAS